MTVLVTGGAGFLGRAICQRFIDNGVEAVAFDNLARHHVKPPDWPEGLKFINGNILDLGALLDYTENVETVVHCAAVNGTQLFYSDPGNVIRVGVEGTMNVIRACNVRGIKHMIYMSSSEVYHDAPTPTTEKVRLIVQDPHNPRFTYSGSKIIGELACLHALSDATRLSIIRPHNIYGPNMGTEHVIPQLLQKALASEGAIRLRGDGSQVRAFCHIDDFIKGFACVHLMGKHREIYNIGNPDSGVCTIGQLAEMILDYIGGPARKVRYGEALEGDPQKRIPNIDKLRRLGFAPNIFIATGIKGTLQWYIDNL